MRECSISRDTYKVAAVTLLKEAGFEIDPLRVCEVVAKKNSRSLYIDIAGKHLP